MLIFGSVGDFLMKNLYRIEMRDLRIAGGILLAGLAFKNILAPKTKDDTEILSLSEEEQIKLGVIPMAFPMMVGPGSLATMLIVRSQAGAIDSSISLFLAFCIVGFVCFNDSFSPKGSIQKALKII